MTSISTLWRAAILTCLVAIIAAATIPQTKTGSTYSVTGNLKLIFHFGVGGKNILNTYNETFTKDMVIDPPITTNLVLTREELKIIEKKLIEMGFFTRSDITHNRGPGDIFGIQTPYSSFYLQVERNDEVRELRWTDEYTFPETSDMRNLDQLSYLIIKMVIEKPEYKSLPEPRSGYL